jgi:hypothetical protein
MERDSELTVSQIDGWSAQERERRRQLDGRFRQIAQRDTEHQIALRRSRRHDGV